MTNVVGERFQITIDKAVREALGVQPGDLAYERVEHGRLVVDFIPKPHRRSMLGILHRPGMEPVTDWSAVKDRAWQARTDEIMEVLRRDSERHRETVAGSDEQDG
jgi:bifunctional DNA-binding transcriptional regulator/antitoxin component of YhaV-PrlF toxin-antitoxin module